MGDKEINYYRFHGVPKLYLSSYKKETLQKIADEITASGFAFIMTSKVKGQVVIRLSICSHRTTKEDIEKVFAELFDIGKSLIKKDAF